MYASRPVPPSSTTPVIISETRCAADADGLERTVQPGLAQHQPDFARADVRRLGDDLTRRQHSLVVRVVDGDATDGPRAVLAIQLLGGLQLSLGHGRGEGEDLHRRS